MPLTITEVAQKLGVSYDVVYREVVLGRLKAYKVGRTIRIPEAEFDAYFAACAIVPPPKAGRRPKQEVWKPGMRLRAALTKP